jgi:hypothetical protein
VDPGRSLQQLNANNTAGDGALDAARDAGNAGQPQIERAEEIGANRRARRAGDDVARMHAPRLGGQAARRDRAEPIRDERHDQRQQVEEAMDQQSASPSARASGAATKFARHRTLPAAGTVQPRIGRDRATRELVGRAVEQQSNNIRWMMFQPPRNGPIAASIA